MATFVWSKHNASYLLNLLCKGSAKADFEAYINGTNFVKNSNIHCQLSKSFWYKMIGMTLSALKIF